MNENQCKSDNAPVDIRELKELAIYLEGIYQGKGNILPLGKVHIENIWIAIKKLSDPVNNIKAEQIMATQKDWKQIESEFIKWDNATHSNASQRQILDWFRDKFIEQESQPRKSAEIFQHCHQCGNDWSKELHCRECGNNFPFEEKEAAQFQGKELREELVKAFNWITRKDSPYAICYGEDMPFATTDEDFTVEEIVDEYLKFR
jgi:hypothetical protein